MNNLKVEVTEKVIEKLKTFKDGTTGLLFTVTAQEKPLTVLGLTLRTTVEDDASCDTLGAGVHIPGGTLSSGAFIITSRDDDDTECNNDLLLRYNTVAGKFRVSCVVDGEISENVNIVIINEADVAKKFYFIHSKFALPVSFEVTEQGIRSMIDNLRTMVERPFILELQNIPSNKSYQSVDGKNSFSSLKDLDIKTMTVLLDNSPPQEDEARKALLIDYKKRPTKCCWFDMTLDSLTIVPKSATCSLIKESVAEGFNQSLDLHEDCLLSQLNNKNEFGVPETFHFFLEDAGHHLSVVYPRNKLDRDLGDFRKQLHTTYALSVDRPQLMRGNALSFVKEIPGTELINPHEAVGPSGVIGGEPSLVQGRYTYHHYCQQGCDDDGWGCAYRSLQTLCSWFKLQGYTNRPIPTLKEIQQCLVGIGDKPSSFVNSRQWIGSTEVGFCLDTLLGVASRIVTVSSGDEMSMKGGELSHHFRTQGSPVMIGGGNLAHTILGVDYNKKTGDIKFLILDPHYTGGEDLSAIISKGWCGWKGPNFWKKGYFYNMCMPIKPKCI